MPAWNWPTGKGVVTRQITLTIGYDRTSLVVKYPGKTVRDTVYAVKKTGALYRGKVGLDYYGRPGPRHAHGTGVYVNRKIGQVLIEN